MSMTLPRCALLTMGLMFTALVAAQTPLLSTCGIANGDSPACYAVRGERSEGWLQQSRSEVMARNGLVTTSQPLAAQAGLRILMQGGNAVDAAVATAATLSVVEPMNVGLAGDLFAIIYVAKDHRAYVLDASGVAPAAHTIALLESLGYRADVQNFGPGSGMPHGGILPVTVPGAVWGWKEVLARFGTMGFERVLQPAIDYAQNGFPISERIAHDWVLPPALPLRGCCSELDPDSIATWYVNGKAPPAGTMFRNRGLAKTLRLLQRGGRDAFYRGAIAEAIVAKSTALGGTMTLADLATYHGRWVEAASTRYGGYEVLELPPPSQAWAADEMLNILATCVQKLTGRTLAALGPADPVYWHMLVEAKKLAYADLFTYNADPDFVHVPVKRLLSSAYAASLCARIDPKHAGLVHAVRASDGPGDTIVVSTADRWGNMVSWVNSNYADFGSGITVPGYGFVLHNRGALFSLDPNSPNALGPHKRPFNTLSAAFVMRDHQPLMALQLRGGDMQAQGHVQVLVNILDLGANVQAAGDMARFRHVQSTNTLMLEEPLFKLVGEQLEAMGHVVTARDRNVMGGYQAILFTPDPSEPGPLAGDHRTPVNGYYRAGSDFGDDGEAVGW